MPRKTLIRSDFIPYHVTARANNRESFYLSSTEIWRILCDEIYLCGLTFSIEVHAFVLMPNHFHLILTTPREDLGTVMNSFLSYVTKSINLRSGRSGRVFGARYHWSLIRDGSYYSHALKYVYRNPVKAGLVERVEDFPFSTLAGLNGICVLPFPIHIPRCGHGQAVLERSAEHLLTWYNKPTSNDFEVSLSRAFKRSVFKLPNDRVRRRVRMELTEAI